MDSLGASVQGLYGPLSIRFSPILTTCGNVTAGRAQR